MTVLEKCIRRNDGGVLRHDNYGSHVLDGQLFIIGVYVVNVLCVQS
jgi:hypothetical protein